MATTSAKRPPRGELLPMGRDKRTAPQAIRIAAQKSAVSPSHANRQALPHRVRGIFGFKGANAGDGLRIQGAGRLPAI